MTPGKGWLCTTPALPVTGRQGVDLKHTSQQVGSPQGSDKGRSQAEASFMLLTQARVAKRGVTNRCGLQHVGSEGPPGKP